MLDAHEIAWAAGFYDGEGSARFTPDMRRTKPTGTLIMSVTQCNRDTLERFQGAVLGLGRINGPYEGRTTNASLQWVWHCTKWQDRQAVTALLWRFIGRQKRDQLLKAYRAEAAQHCGHQEHYYVRRNQRRGCRLCDKSFGVKQAAIMRAAKEVRHS